MGQGLVFDQLVRGLYCESPECTCKGLQVCPTCKDGLTIFQYATAYSRVFLGNDYEGFGGVMNAVTTISSRGEAWLMCSCVPDRQDFLIEAVDHL